MTAAIEGFVAPGFEGVKAAFAANFEGGGKVREVGASFAAYHDGRLVADLWGGFANAARTRSWRQDTLANVWSSTKGAAAVAVARLVDQGALRYEDRVSDHWPEYAQAGKGETTVAHVMSHQAGLPGFVEPTATDDLFDWPACIDKLERQAPAWRPGEATSYHALTYGFLAGEIIRRVSGQSAGAYLQAGICGPLGCDFYVGLPEPLESRMAEMIAPSSPPSVAKMTPEGMMAVTNPNLDPAAPNRRAWRAAELPAANGQANALGLARLYAMLAQGGSLDGQTILSPEGVARMTSPADAPAGRRDLFLGFTDSWAMGVILNTPKVYGSNPRAYGHSGWGGSFGAADPDAKVAMGYVCNQMAPDLVGDPRTAGLCRSVLDAAAHSG